MRKRIIVGLGLVPLLAAGVAGAAIVGSATPPPAPPTTIPSVTPIEHVVVIMQENHSFDETLGKLCVDDARCDGALVGKLKDGTTWPLRQAPDLVPNVAHRVPDQIIAVDKGLMDGFSRISGCSGTNHPCYQYYDPTQIPNLAALARQYVVADRAFTASDAPSWGGHIAMVTPGNGWVNGWNPAYNWDGFTGNIPIKALGVPAGKGWGCDSNLVAPWKSAQTALSKLQPSCIPKVDGTGAFRPTPVRHVSTIMDSLDAAGVPWKIYGTLDPSDTGYPWNICPTFADCLAKQSSVVTARTNFAADAAAGNLPGVSFVIPNLRVSQHNGASMAVGDNWIGQNVQAVMSGPDWQSTAIFVTYDDCGCFYDHVNPNTPVTGFGIRVPFVIVSPWARPGFTDSNVTSSTTGILSFIEHNWRLPAIGNEDQYYDFSQSFDWGQPPVAPVPMTNTPVQNAPTPTEVDGT